MDYGKIFKTIVDETAKYLINNNLKTMVLGISGGLDSTICAAICHEVVVKYSDYDFRFIGVSLPCSTNSDEENKAAKSTMEAYCNKDNCWVENLEKEYILMKSTCDKHGASTGISQGNIKARLRMIYLYNLASINNGLVIDTDNLTEHYLGFFTIHGDQGDFNPIGGLWKHELYELATWLRDKHKGQADYVSPDSFCGIDDIRDKEEAQLKVNALERAINITPTDGNGVKDGGDMAQIAPGHTYKDVDDILSTFIEYRGRHPEEYQIAMNELYIKYGEETVVLVLERMRRSEFKRKNLPIVVKREVYSN